jgi:hypothetical protein
MNSTKARPNRVSRDHYQEVTDRIIAVELVLALNHPAATMQFPVSYGCDPDRHIGPRRAAIRAAPGTLMP